MGKKIVADDVALAVTADKGYDAPENYELLHDRGQGAAIMHGLVQARYWGIAKMKFQSLITAIAVNVKRMVALVTGRPRWVLT